MIVTQWYGKKTIVDEILIHVQPPDKVRREFLDLDGTIKRVSISAANVENVILIRDGKILRGNAVGSNDKIMPPDIERNVLMSNYELSSSTGENIAGHPTWCLTMKPKIRDKSWEMLWLDRETNVVLRKRRYFPHRRFASVAQFIAFEPRKPQNASLFIVNESSKAIETRGLAPQFLTLEQLNQATDNRSRFPLRLPGGFIFESADVFPVGKSKVLHARYTDGLTVLSLFQTDRPVRLPKEGIIPSGDAHLPGPLHASRAGKLIQWSAGSRHYTLMGDVSRELVADMIKSMR